MANLNDDMERNIMRELAPKGKARCAGCGGVLGQDCFNPNECLAICRQKAAAFDALPFSQDEFFRLLDSRIAWQNAATLLYAVTCEREGRPDIISKADYLAIRKAIEHAETIDHRGPS